MCSVHSEHNERHTHNVLWAAPGVKYLRAYSLAKEAMLHIFVFSSLLVSRRRTGAASAAGCPKEKIGSCVLQLFSLCLFLLAHIITIIM